MASSLIGRLSFANCALGCLAGMTVTTLLGLVLWAFIVLPLWRRRRPVYVILLGTIVYGAILGVLALLVLGSMPQTLPPWIPGFELDIGESRVQGQYIVVIAATLAMMAAVSAVLGYTTLGRTMRACAANRDTSELLGISAERMGFMSFAITAALGGYRGRFCCVLSELVRGWLIRCHFAKDFKVARLQSFKADIKSVNRAGNE